MVTSNLYCAIKNFSINDYSIKADLVEAFDRQKRLALVKGSATAPNLISFTAINGEEKAVALLEELGFKKIGTIPRALYHKGEKTGDRMNVWFCSFIDEAPQVEIPQEAKVLEFKPRRRAKPVEAA